MPVPAYECEVCGSHIRVDGPIQFSGHIMGYKCEKCGLFISLTALLLTKRKMIDIEGELGSTEERGFTSRW